MPTSKLLRSWARRRAHGARRLTWALPGVVFAAALSLSAACASGGPELPPQSCPNNDNNSGAGASGTGTGTGGTTGSGMAEPTPQEVAARLHGCRKVRYASLGNILADRGVDLTTFGGSGAICRTDGSMPCPVSEQCYCPTPPCFQVGNETPNDGTCVTRPATPGFLYSTAHDAMGVPKLDSRQGEKDGHTTASAMKLFDIFIQAAPQIIANIDSPQLAPACTLNGQNPSMFDPGDGSCVEEAVSCLIGYPATDDHMLLCNLILDKANAVDPADVAIKRNIAVAAMLSAAHSCE